MYVVDAHLQVIFLFSVVVDVFHSETSLFSSLFLSFLPRHSLRYSGRSCSKNTKQSIPTKVMNSNIPLRLKALTFNGHGG